MNAMHAYRNLKRAQHAAAELRSNGGTFPFAEAFFVNRPTRELLESLYELGILEPDDLERVPERGPLINAA
jgi:hypothetical protein